jgi:DNA-binding NarL/FixJ family response regulator
MNQALPRLAPDSPDVAVIAADAAQTAALEALVRKLGLRLVAPAHAQVVLSDQEPANSTTPTLVISTQEAARASWLPVTASTQQIDIALRATLAGLIVRPPREASTEGFDELPEPAAPRLLTPRELEVLHSIGAGSSNKSIARELGISQHTVKSHIESLLRKLGARTRAEALAKALRQQIDL